MLGAENEVQRTQIQAHAARIQQLMTEGPASLSLRVGSGSSMGSLGQGVDAGGTWSSCEFCTNNEFKVVNMEDQVQTAEKAFTKANQQTLKVRKDSQKKGEADVVKYTKQLKMRLDFQEIELKKSFSDQLQALDEDNQQFVKQITARLATVVAAHVELEDTVHQLEAVKGKTDDQVNASVSAQAGLNSTAEATEREADTDDTISPLYTANADSSGDTTVDKDSTAANPDTSSAATTTTTANTGTAQQEWQVMSHAHDHVLLRVCVFACAVFCVYSSLELIPACVLVCWCAGVDQEALTCRHCGCGCGCGCGGVPSGMACGAWCVSPTASDCPTRAFMWVLWVMLWADRPPEKAGALLGISTDHSNKLT